MSDATAPPTGALAPGGAALELNADKNLVFLRLNRVACARMSDALAKAAASRSGALVTGSEEAEELTDYLNKSLGSNELAFGEIALDESLPDADLSRSRAGFKNVGVWLLMAVVALALVRGVLALGGDGWALINFWRERR